MNFRASKLSLLLFSVTYDFDREHRGVPERRGLRGAVLALASAKTMVGIMGLSRNADASRSNARQRSCRTSSAGNALRRWQSWVVDDALGVVQRYAHGIPSRR